MELQFHPDSAGKVYDDHFQAESGWNSVPCGLCLEVVIRILLETYQCRMYSRKLPVMDREDARNM
jgi:hypothetical protein